MQLLLWMQLLHGCGAAPQNVERIVEGQSVRGVFVPASQYEAVFRALLADENDREIAAQEWTRAFSGAEPDGWLLLRAVQTTLALPMNQNEQARDEALSRLQSMVRQSETELSQSEGYWLSVAALSKAKNDSASEQHALLEAVHLAPESPTSLRMLLQQKFLSQEGWTSNDRERLSAAFLSAVFRSRLRSDLVEQEAWLELLEEFWMRSEISSDQRMALRLLAENVGQVLSFRQRISEKLQAMDPRLSPLVLQTAVAYHRSIWAIERLLELDAATYRTLLVSYQPHDLQSAVAATELALHAELPALAVAWLEPYSALVGAHRPLLAQAWVLTEECENIRSFDAGMDPELIALYRTAKSSRCRSALVREKSF